MAEYPMMTGVERQELGVHYGNAVVYEKAIDRRDCVAYNKIERPHEFTCTHLVHYTENAFAESIGLWETDEPFCFKPKLCYITNKKFFKLTWWSPFLPANCEEVIKNNLSNVLDEFEDIGNSAAFNGDSLCGPVGFVISWKNILKQYAISRHSSLQDVELRILGTFLYRKEIMYGVLVCVKGDKSVESFPLVHPGEATEAFVPMDTNFIWKVYSTVGYSDNRPRHVDWTWDHVSFGFYFPTSTNLNLQPDLCTITKKKCGPYIPLSRREQSEFVFRTRKDMVASQNLIDCLNQKIQVAKILKRIRIRDVV